MVRKILAVMAVAGMVAMVSALPSAGAGNPIAGQTGTMGVSYTVMSYAELTVVPNAAPLTGNALLAAPPAGAPGNLGYITVETNYVNWDVTVSATNLGRLISQDASWNTHVLTGPTDTDTLRVSLVVWARPASGADGPPVGTALITGTALNSATPVSLAALMGASINTNSFLGRDGTDIATDGFPSTEHITNTAPGGLVRININAGLGTYAGGVLSGAVSPAVVGGNADGVYTETLTFTLHANF